MNLIKKSFLALTLCAALATPTEIKPMDPVIVGFTFAIVSGLALVTNGIYTLCTLKDLPYSVLYKDEVASYELVVENTKNKTVLNSIAVKSTDPAQVIEECMQFCIACDPYTTITISPEITLTNSSTYQLKPVTIKRIQKEKSVSSKRWAKTKKTLTEKLSQKKHTLKNRSRPQQYTRAAFNLYLGSSLLLPFVIILPFFLL